MIPLFFGSLASRLSLAVLLVLLTPAQAQTNYAAREDVQAFVAQMVERHQFDSQPLLDLFAQVRFDASIVRLMAPPSPGFKRSWAVYRQRFLDPLRVREGLRFWRDHEAVIKRASAQYGVPESIIVAIIGVETIYGRVTGDYRVIDALTVLAFDYPRRAAFFREELEQFLLLTRREPEQRLSMKGSFAGAIGLPQFMPGSIMRHATDFDGDGRIDLRTSAADAIGSVARFLANHGWQPGEPTHFAVSFEPNAAIDTLLGAGIEPQFTIEQLRAQGVGSPDAPPATMKLALIDLPNGDAPTSYWLGAPNFYVITRYNRSSFYAMAVIDLARLLAQRRTP
jgi:membrane-bound lytic murein transglycosylase B